MKRIFAVLSALLLTLSLCACGAEQAQDAQLFAMDTIMDFEAYGTGAGDALSDSKAEIIRLEKLLSRTKENSEITKINDQAGTPTEVDAEVASLLKSALEYSAATDGAYDITVAPIVSAWGFIGGDYRVPSQEELNGLLKDVGYGRITLSGTTVTLGAGQSIDLGGIAKGYASDRVAAIYAKDGVTSGMISLGGNVWVCGKKPDGTDWRVAVQDPNDSSTYVGILSLSDAFAVTSGAYQRNFTQDGKTYHHIIDPTTGYPAESGLTSVTIVAKNGTMSDAFSTALFVAGKDKAISFWRSGKYDFDMVLVTSDNQVLVTSGIAAQFEKAEGSGYAYETIG